MQIMLLGSLHFTATVVPLWGRKTMSLAVLILVLYNCADWQDGPSETTHSAAMLQLDELYCSTLCKGW